MKEALAKLKAEQKVLAAQIKEIKSKRKETRGYYAYSESQQYRIKHIAYCLLRGRTLEQIEPKLRDPNGYQHAWVRKQASKIVATVLEAAHAVPKQ